MTGLVRWMTTLGTIRGISTFLVVLVGLIVIAVAYFRKKNRVALLGAIGFLILFLFNCCSLGWGFADNPVLKRLPSRSVETYYTAKSVVIFLIGLVNLVGLGLIIAALWIGSRKE